MEKINIDRLMAVLSEILSEKYGMKITMRAIPKSKYQEEKQNESANHPNQ